MGVKGKWREGVKTRTKGLSNRETGVGMYIGNPGLE